MNSYNTLPELLSMYLHAKEVLAALTSRRSNNSMFIRMDDESIKEMYQKTTRLYMYISTLETYLYNSPLYPSIICECSLVTSDSVNVSNDVDITDDLREHYKGIYSRLFTCIQLLISSIPSSQYGNLKYDKDSCLSIVDSEEGDEDLPCVDVGGDFNLDFNFDFFVGEICE